MPLSMRMILLAVFVLTPLARSEARIGLLPPELGNPGANLTDFDNLEGYVSPDQVFKLHGADPSAQVRLLDVRPRADYDAGHLPKAVWVDVKQAEEIARRPGGLIDQQAWIEWSKPLGLMASTWVIIMDGDRQLDAARVWWLLRYLGVEHAGLVDGNFGLWQIQRRPVTQVVPDVPPNPFPVDFQAKRLANRDDMLATLQKKDARVIDARSVEEFFGQNVRAKRGGHIPDACRLEWLDFVDKYGRFLPKQRIAEKLAAAGLTPGESVVTHCQGGGRASVDAFVFEAMDYPTRNFYLGWSDWGNAADTPITTEETRIVPREPVAATVPTVPGLLPYAPPAPAKMVITNVSAVAEPEPAVAAKPFVVEYYYQCQWGHADEFLALFQRNHLPILRERIVGGDILKVSMTKPRIHTAESTRWDYRVTIEFRDVAAAFNSAADEPIKQRLFPDQAKYKAEEQRRFAILIGHTDLPIEEVDLEKPITAP